MPISMRKKDKAQKIAQAILGSQQNMPKKRKRKKKEDDILSFEESRRS